MYENLFFAPLEVKCVGIFFKLGTNISKNHFVFSYILGVGGGSPLKVWFLEPQGILLENFHFPIQYGRVNFEPTLKNPNIILFLIMLK